MIGSCGSLKDASALPGFIAEDGTGKLLGLLTCKVTDNELEVVTLDALVKYRGVGTALLDAVIEFAKQEGVKRIYLATTNDNIDALRFYQRRGFRFGKIFHDAVTELRKQKPSIPLVGEYGIALKDELELEYHLCK